MQRQDKRLLVFCSGAGHRSAHCSEMLARQLEEGEEARRTYVVVQELDLRQREGVVEAHEDSRLHKDVDEMHDLMTKEEGRRPKACKHESCSATLACSGYQLYQALVDMRPLSHDCLCLTLFTCPEEATSISQTGNQTRRHMTLHLFG